jgi:hypothetical protein
MKLIFVNLVALGVMFGSVMPAQVSAADDQAAVQAEHALNAALSKGDKTAAGQLLDANFEWTNAEGKTRTKAETLQALPAFAKDALGEMEVQTHNFGQVERFVGRHRSTRFAHLWVKRAEGWRAFSFLDTPIPAAGYRNRPSPPKGKGEDCINPCKVLPYKPANAAQLGCWLSRTKRLETVHIVLQWCP